MMRDAAGDDRDCQATKHIYSTRELGKWLNYLKNDGRYTK